MINLQSKRYIKFAMIAFFIAILFIFVNSFIIRSIENHFYETKKSEAVSISKDYAQNLIYSTRANNLINALFEEKIKVASKISNLEQFNIMDANLDELAELLGIDRIYYYDPQGKIIASTNDEYLHWTATEGHPVDEFIQSKKDFYVEEDLRKDTGSNEYFKYGYYRRSNNSIIQIGIHSDEIELFLGKFEISNRLKDISESEQIAEVSFYHSDLKTLETPDGPLSISGSDVPPLFRIFRNGENRIYSEMNAAEDRFEVYVPIKVETSIIGTLAIDFSFKDTQHLVSTISNISTIVFILIYGFVLFIIFTNVRMDQRLVNLAYYDSLTNLPNLEYFVEAYNEEVNFVKHDKAVFVIKFVSIPTINMVHGYKSGSVLLKRIAKRLEVLNYDGVLDIFKSSGDEFIVYGENLESKEEVLEYVSKINDLLSKPFILNNTKIFVKYKIAIIHKEKNYLDKSLLLKESNITLNSININDGVNYAFYDEKMEIKLHRMENIKNELRLIIENDNRQNNIYMNYQPLIDLKSNKVIAFEALARFQSDNYGRVSPFEFIEIAEKNQLIIPLSHIILRESCDFISALRKNNYKNTKLAINISGAHLLSEGFVDEIMKITNLSNIDLTMIELEITESLLMNNFLLINEKLEQLQTKGISISLDDFGTGYSSFARLAELNIDCLKIDKSFIDKILVWEEDDIIAGEIIAMAHRFGIKVIAEGVEETKQLEYLKRHNCDIIQGYLYSKPLSQKDALDYIENNQADH